MFRIQFGTLHEHASAFFTNLVIPAGVIASLKDTDRIHCGIYFLFQKLPISAEMLWIGNPFSRNVKYDKEADAYLYAVLISIHISKALRIFLTTLTIRGFQAKYVRLEFKVYLIKLQHSLMVSDKQSGKLILTIFTLMNVSDPVATAIGWDSTWESVLKG